MNKTRFTINVEIDNEKTKERKYTITGFNSINEAEQACDYLNNNVIHMPKDYIKRVNKKHCKDLVKAFERYGFMPIENRIEQSYQATYLINDKKYNNDFKQNIQKTFNEWIKKEKIDDKLSAKKPFVSNDYSNLPTINDSSDLPAIYGNKDNSDDTNTSFYAPDLDDLPIDLDNLDLGFNLLTADDLDDANDDVNSTPLLMWLADNLVNKTLKDYPEVRMTVDNQLQHELELALNGSQINLRFQSDNEQLLGITTHFDPSDNKIMLNVMWDIIRLLQIDDEN